MAAEDAPLLEDIVAEANHMADLANNLLTLARLVSRDDQDRDQGGASQTTTGHRAMLATIRAQA